MTISAAFLVYIVLWTQLYRSEQRRIAISLQQYSEFTGLIRRGLIKVVKPNPTAVPHYELVRHWIRRRARKPPAQ